MPQSFRRQDARGCQRSSSGKAQPAKIQKKWSCSIPPISNCKILIKRQGQRESGAALGAIWDCGYAPLVGEGRTPRRDVTRSLDWIRETGLNCTLTNSPFSHCQSCPSPPPPPRNHPHHKLFQQAENRKVRRCKQVKVSRRIRTPLPLSSIVFILTMFTPLLSPDTGLNQPQSSIRDFHP